MHSCNPFDSAAGKDVIFAARPSDLPPAGETSFTITELASEFGVTHRALRFYESRGLLAPKRQGRRRLYTGTDRARLTVILQGKKLGFTITEIGEMVEAQAGRVSTHALTVTAEKCLEQIAFFERQIREAEEALTELRSMHRLLTQKR